MVIKKRGLGRGLDALLPPETPVQPTGGLEDVPLEWIKPGKYQPRSCFSRESISELAASIKTQGLLQPIVLRLIAARQYEIIAGERRWRAAQEAGLRTLPAIIRVVADEEVIAMSLVENIQRENLNSLEEARALQRLIDEFQFTHQQVAESLGRSRSSVTNTLRLTQLTEPVAEMLMRGEIEMGHARALLTLDASGQVSVARTVVAQGLNVRQAETLVSRHTKPRKASGKRQADADTQRLENNLSMSLGQPVQIRHTSRGKGKVVISYNSLDELDGLLGKMGYRSNKD